MRSAGTESSNELQDAEIPEHRLNAFQRVHERWLMLRYSDPVQRQAQHFIFDDLSNVGERLQAYSRELEPVRRQVIMELERRVATLGSGRATAAWSSLIQTAVAAVTIFGALLLAVLNGWFGTIVKMTDEESGVIRGLTQTQFSDTLAAVQSPLVLALLALLTVAIWTQASASSKDSLRGVSISWLRLFSDFEDSRRTETESQMNWSDGVAFWARLRRTN